ncbi:MAG TPA: hypothetical protein HPP94_10830 [Desulfuromonadales bacterium]|nr:hypothetical protein [Desulfuromonadales bacterium]
MKKRYSIIFTVTAAAVLVSSIAYASKKKLRSKPEHLKQGMSEVDLASHLSDTSRSGQHTSPKDRFAKNREDELLKDLTMIDESTAAVKAAVR